MTGRPNRGGPPPASAAMAAQNRQNEYFVPRDGIDREVITSDICRYLGNDALVRPGTYESPDGRVTQGYFITAYRNLTSAMIQDLKADSARWEQERRAAARAQGGGAGGTPHANGAFMRGSNSPTGAREPPRGQPDYISWKNRQLDTTSYAGVPPGDRMDLEYSSPPVPQPTYGSPAYPGGPQGGYPPAPYPPPVHPGSAGGYGQPPPPPNYGYPAPGGSQYSPGPPNSADRYPGMAAPPPGPPVYPAQEVQYVHGGDFRSNPGGYAPPGPSRVTPMSMSTGPPSRTFNPTAGAPGYPEPDAFGNYGTATGNPMNSVPFPGSNLPNPSDPVYGRAPGGAYNTTTTSQPPPPSDDIGSNAGTAPPRQSYSAGPEPQFDDRQSPSLPNAPTPTNGNPSQIPPAGQPAARRDTERGDRDRDRDHRRRTDQDRDDRHAAERRHRRHNH